MKPRMWTLFAVGAFLALPVSVGLAQNQQLGNHPPNYTVINLGTLGGTNGIAEGINNEGVAGGFADLPNDTNEHALVWLSGLKIDLGTFGGPNSQSEFAPNIFGQATGVAETSIPDPLGEDFCGFGTHLRCLPFLWQFGFKIPLPTLGGDNGGGNDINSSGQVVGLAETAVHDPTCVAPQVLQSLPAVWENGRVRALPTFDGDPDGYALANNDLGQAVGGSGNCSTNPDAHALLWQNGKVTNLGSLGGAMNNAPQDINNLGHVVGFSDLPGDTTDHAFLWRNGKMIDLGTLAGYVSDIVSVAIGINDHDQIVGYSCGGPNGNCGAFLWQNGTMTDLNALVPANSSLYLLVAFGINDSGEIVGYGYDSSTGDYPPFLAIPSPDGGDSGVASSAAQLNSVPKVTLPENVRKLTQPRRGRLGVVQTGPQ